MILYKIYRNGTTRVDLERVNLCTLEHNDSYVNLDLASCLKIERHEAYLPDCESWESSEGAE